MIEWVLLLFVCVANGPAEKKSVPGYVTDWACTLAGEQAARDGASEGKRVRFLCLQQTRKS